MSGIPVPQGKGQKVCTASPRPAWAACLSRPCLKKTTKQHMQTQDERGVKALPSHYSRADSRQEHHTAFYMVWVLWGEYNRKGGEAGRARRALHGPYSHSNSQSLLVLQSVGLRIQFYCSSPYYRREVLESLYHWDSLAGCHLLHGPVGHCNTTQAGSLRCPLKTRNNLGLQLHSRLHFHC